MMLATIGLLAGCSTPATGVSDSDAELRRELSETRAQVDQLRAQTARLEQEIRAFELSNGQLRPATQENQSHWNNPVTNQAPHLTPLQSQ
jgi:hypothetical protein